MFEELKKMNEELEVLKKNHLERSKEMFTTVSKLLFEKHPALESFQWQQYTPYFNDGEECTFSANKDYLSINGIEADTNFKDKEITNYSGANKAPYPMKTNEDYNPDLALAEEDAIEFLSNIDDSVLRDLFGDHVEITVFKDRTEVEEYDHD